MTIDEQDLKYVRRSLELAAVGKGQVSPNPLVGCVIVASDGGVVGEGTYLYDDIKHAEVIALEQAGVKARGATAYVSLEPHAHQNRTPPCTEALISAGVRRVVAPIEDPNPLVSGLGFSRLRAAGVEVETGILVDEATKLNEKFIGWHRNHRPFVHLKLAMSLDGRISLQSSVSTALSSVEASSRVQDLRHDYDAILIGGNTAYVDDPQLTDRSGRVRRRPLVRVVLDNRLRLPVNSKLVATAPEIPTIVFSNSENEARVADLKSHDVEVIGIDARNLRSVLDYLRQRDIQSILVEGGTEIAGSFRDGHLIDKVTLIAAPLIIGGTQAPVAVGGNGASSLAEAMELRDVTIAKLGNDIEITGYPTR